MKIHGEKMIFSSSFRKTIFISLLGHLTVLSIFSFSFGKKMPQLNYSQVSFWGAILERYELISQQPFLSQNIKRELREKLHTLPLDKARPESLFIPNCYLKPQIDLAFNQDKLIFLPKIESEAFLAKKKEFVVMLYPQLPENFLLYFKDRQRVHIELEFNVFSADRSSSLEIKRKISSGNLEADLLSMRYISHYLFIQRMRFAPHQWQTLKIDLSTKND